MIFKGAEQFEADRVDRARLKRTCRKGEPLPANCGNVWTCVVCDRSLLSKAGLVNHMKSHGNNQARAVPVAPLNVPTESQQAGFSCSHCPKVCKSAGGLKRHLKSHGNDVPVAATSAQVNQLECPVCSKQCKSLAGLKSHLRAHGRSTDEGVAIV